MDKLEDYLEWQDERPEVIGPFQIRFDDGEVISVEVKNLLDCYIVKTKGGWRYNIQDEKFDDVEWKLDIP
jgi:hypothetical protein